MAYSLEQKIKALRREITLRKAVYPTRVKVGTMSQKTADYEIDIFKSILRAYERKLEKQNAD